MTSKIVVFSAAKRDDHPVGRHIGAARNQGNVVEFMVDLTVQIPQDATPAEIARRSGQESEAAAALVASGNLVRLWQTSDSGAQPIRLIGLYRAESERALTHLLRPLPLGDWLSFHITALTAHANDPGDRATHTAQPS